MNDPLAALPSLVLLTGPETGRRIPLTTGRKAVVGRSLEADLTFPDEPSLSRFHARIDHEDDQYMITDLGSVNGTQINGKDIQREIPTPLAHRDVITCGELELRFELPEAQRAAAGSHTMVLTRPDGERSLPRIRAIIATESRPLETDEDEHESLAEAGATEQLVEAAQQGGEAAGAPAEEAVIGEMQGAETHIEPDEHAAAVAASGPAIEEPISAEAPAEAMTALDASVGDEQESQPELPAGVDGEPETAQATVASPAPVEAWEPEEAEVASSESPPAPGWEQPAMPSAAPATDAGATSLGLVAEDLSAGAPAERAPEIEPAWSVERVPEDVGDQPGPVEAATEAPAVAEPPAMTPLERAVATVPLFRTLSDAEISTLARTMTQRQFPPGAEIVRQGEEGLSLYIVLEGQVRVQRAGVTQGEIELATIGPGGFFGEMTLLDGEPRSATVRAVTPVFCALLPRWGLEATIRANPAVAMEMLSVLSRRLRATEGLLTA
jgi:CRP/FNR family cyclic AMP-dependent transcriptional regulator